MSLADQLARAERLLAARAYAAARAAFEDVLRAHPATRSALVRLGQIALTTHDYADACAALEQALALGGEDAEVTYLLGRAQRAVGAVDLAEASFRRALALDARHDRSWTSLGTLLNSTGRPDEAEASLRRAIAVHPGSAEAHLNLGNLLAASARPDEARTCLEASVRLAPHLAAAHCALGRVLLDLRQPVEACIPAFETALRCDPAHYDALLLLAQCQLRAGAFEAAAAAAEAARRLRPGDPVPQLLLCNALIGADRPEPALSLCTQVLAEEPRHAEALLVSARALERLGRSTDAHAAYEAALAAAPDDPSVQLAAAQFFLRQRDFARGWRLYEARHDARIADAQLARSLPFPQWQGEALAQKTLLVTAEQGLGDEIMFASSLRELQQQGARLYVECDRRLAPLLERSFPGLIAIGVSPDLRVRDDSLARRLEELPAPDFWVRTGTQHGRLRPSLESFPRAGAWLHADPARVTRWRNLLNETGNRLCVGLSWRGGMALTHAASRSCGLARLQPLLELTGITFVSLQYGAEAALEVEDFRNSTGLGLLHAQAAHDDYEETAALVASLDLVVTVCTALVHLAGALGTRTLVLAPVVPEWRYGSAGATMPWYPSVEVLRQPAAGAWSPVVDDVRTRLGALLADADCASRSVSEP